MNGREREKKSERAGESRVSPHSSPALPAAPLWRRDRGASGSSFHLPID